jgi:hypothetical protein
LNQRLTDNAIRKTCRELLATSPRVTGRELRRVLKQKYQAVGKTERVFRIWREEQNAQAEAGRAVPITLDQQEILERLTGAETAAEQNRLRAERAELREQAHQDRWAAEVDQLRQAVKAQPKYAAELRALQEQVLRLTVELHAARRLLAERNPPDHPSP